MPSRTRIRAMGIEQSDATRRRLAREARQLRMQAGLGQAELAKAVGVSRQWIHRFEAGRPRSVDLIKVTLVFAFLGQRLSVKAFPTGEPLRDAGHARLLERFNARSRRCGAGASRCR